MILGIAFGLGLGGEQFQILFQELLLGIILGIAFGANFGDERGQTLFWELVSGAVLGIQRFQMLF